MKISIIIPTHDRPGPLARAADAVLGQSRRPDELIVVDDGTAEIPPDIARRAAEAGVKFVYHRIGPPSSSATRNRGLELADGDIVVMTDDDEQLQGEYLRTLEGLYLADVAGAIGGIGGVVADSESKLFRRRLWNFMARLLGQGSWRPRRMASRYVSLPAVLRGRLKPAGWISGGAISLRREVAKKFRFDEAFAGYAYAEDLEFCYRVGRTVPLFTAGELTVFHDIDPSGRPDMKQRGRMYVVNLLHIVRTGAEGGPGDSLLLVYDFLGMLVLYVGWSLVSRRRREKLEFAAGLACRIADELWRMTKKTIFGS